MTERLNELIRQRALLSDHLAWLDREISLAKAGADSAQAPTAPVPDSISEKPGGHAAGTALPPTSPTQLPTQPGAETTPVETEEILEQYRVNPAAVKQDVRKGCLLYFIGAFAVLGVIVAVLYFAISTR